jgi:hypothetical protein
MYFSTASFPYRDEFHFTFSSWPQLLTAKLFYTHIHLPHALPELLLVA